jgi:uncharacterized repeat protein (TIGR03803 family)
MKVRFIRGLVPLALLVLAGPLPANAQPVFTTLYDFSSDVLATNSDGNAPTGGLVISGSTLYGTALVGGAYGQGTVYAIQTNGFGFTNLHSFTGSNDGAQPFSGLAVAGNVLYGTVRQGGTASNGKLFALDTSGSNFVPLYSFSASVFNAGNNTSTNSDGYGPLGNLIVSGNMLYGTANGGGIFGQGTVFGISTNGSGFTNLHNFASIFGGSGTNQEGANPYCGLVLSGGILYGTTDHGGRFGQGSIFAVNMSGGGFTNLHSFAGSANSDGANAEAGMVLVGDTLYGTTAFGGTNNQGSIFAINTNGTGYKVLRSFPTQSAGTNYDGSQPLGNLIYSGGTLYGTASGGGSSGSGTIFSLNLDGTGFTNLYNFSSPDQNTGTNTDGTQPYAGLILAGDTLYGTAESGGSYQDGTVFALSLAATTPPPTLTITEIGNQTVLSWPTSASGYTLQYITNISTVNWSNITSGIETLGTNFVYTNLLNAPAAYFRLEE